VYLLKNRTQVPNVIKKFINKIKTQFLLLFVFCLLIMLLSLSKLKFFIFFASYGILHQATCPHTSQQNRIAESTEVSLRCSSYIINHMHASKSFSADAILCACHLINKKYFLQYFMIKFFFCVYFWQTDIFCYSLCVWFYLFYSKC